MITVHMFKSATALGSEQVLLSLSNLLSSSSSSSSVNGGGSSSIVTAALSYPYQKESIASMSR